MRLAFPVSAVRAAEERLLARQSRPDELMQLAARAVAAAAEVMLAARPGRVVILAGSGGNGGDGLYAGALLALQGVPVSALVPERRHEQAFKAFDSAGGTVLAAELSRELPADTALLIDAVAGLGSARGLSGDARALYSQAQGVPVLAVDMPTGVDADTGVAAPDAVHATVTVTFGWARMGHVLAPECGEIVLSDLTLDGQDSFAQTLESLAEPSGFIANEPTLRSDFSWRPGDAAPGVTNPRPVGCTGPITDPTPSLSSDKYSGGVTAIAAGSSTYPGAGILSATGAVRASPAMVRFVGDASITSSLPELVVHKDVASAGRAQAWVVGPGRGTDDAAADELAAILSLGLPTVIDADALTLLATRPQLRQAAIDHPLTVLTPHAGEFSRLYEAALGAAPNLDRGYGELLRELAYEMRSFVLLKGRVTRVTAPGQPVYACNAGHSYAATPGSGDVLSGVLGAVLAQMHLEGAAPFPSTTPGSATRIITRIITEILHATAIHAHAAAVAAETPDGYGICSASQIGAAIPQAIARLLVMDR